MTSHPPPVPPDQQSPHAGDIAEGTPERDQLARGNPKFAEQGRQGNVAQNTTNKGLQQDR